MGQTRSVSPALLFTPFISLTFFLLPLSPPSIRPPLYLPSVSLSLRLWVMQLASRLFCPGLFLDVMPWKRKIRLKTERERDISPRLKNLGNLNRFYSQKKKKKKDTQRKGQSVTAATQTHTTRTNTHAGIKKNYNTTTVPHLPRRAPGSHRPHHSEPTAGSITEPDNHLTDWFLKWSFKWIKATQIRVWKWAPATFISTFHTQFNPVLFFFFFF